MKLLALLKSDKMNFVMCVIQLTLLLLPDVVIDARDAIYLSEDGRDNESCGQKEAPCQTLPHVSKYIVSNNSLIIIQARGITLTDVAIFDSITNLILSGTQLGAGINCNCTKYESCGISFQNVQCVAIENLNITSCGMLYNISDGVYYRSALLVNDSSNVLLDTLQISDSTGTGLVMLNLKDNITIMNSQFTKNSHSSTIDVIHGGAGLHIVVTKCNFDALNCSINQSRPAEYTITDTLFTGNELNLTSLEDRYWELSYGGGLGILLWGAKGNSFLIQRSNFTNNRAASGGGLIFQCNGTCNENVVHINESLFYKNVETEHFFGGAGMALGTTYNSQSVPSDNNIIVSNTRFVMNRGFYAAGTLVFATAFDSQNCQKPYNNFQFHNCTWEDNEGIVSSAVDVQPDFASQYKTEFSVQPLFNNCAFRGNRIMKQYLDQYSFYKEFGVFQISRVPVYFKGTTIFDSNNGTALYLSTSSAIFMEGSKTMFTNNEGERGGAIALVGYSSLKYYNNALFYFINNTASFMGGAIYVLNTKPHISITSHSCFLQYYAMTTLPSNVSFIFVNNTAGSKIADAIFSTAISPCRYSCLRYNIPLPTNEMVFSNHSCLGYFYFSNTSNQIASGPSKFNILQDTPLNVIPGKLHRLPVEVVDDINQNITEISVYQSMISENNDDDIRTANGFSFITNNNIKITGESGKRFNLTIFMSTFHVTGANIPVILSSCPPGYVTDNTSRTCICSAGGQFSSNPTYNGIIGCQDNLGVAMVTSGFWVGYILANESESENNLYTGDCPMGFCRYFNNDSSGQYYNLTLIASYEELQEVVCVNERRDILCGRCKDSNSVYFHSDTFKCDKNNWCHIGFLFYVLSELIPITILFILILGFDVCLTNGTAYSLLFMTQVLQATTASRAVEFKPEVLYTIFKVIYNIFNLDFFDIDALSFCLWKDARTLDIIAIKYASVLYAMVLTMLFIYCSKHCTYKLKCHQCCTSNYSVVQGLTAFLVICYFQCVRVTFMLLNYETLLGIRKMPYKRFVVYLDGSLEYFRGIHLVYAVPALICLFTIIIPVPLVLIFDSLLLKIEDKLILQFASLEKLRLWTKMHNKLKPLLDSFQGTFKDEYRFFAGFFFLYRIVILTAFVLSSNAMEYYFWLEVILTILLTVQALLQPFAANKHNMIALLVLCNMALINGLSIRIYTIVSTNRYTIEAQVFQWIQLLLIYAPMFAVIGWTVLYIYKWCIGKMEPKENFSQEFLDTSDYHNYDRDKDYGSLT